MDIQEHDSILNINASSFINCFNQISSPNVTNLTFINKPQIIKPLKHQVNFVLKSTQKIVDSKIFWLSNFHNLKYSSFNKVLVSNPFTSERKLLSQTNTKICKDLKDWQKLEELKSQINQIVDSLL